MSQDCRFSNSSVAEQLLSEEPREFQETKAVPGTLTITPSLSWGQRKYHQTLVKLMVVETPPDTHTHKGAREYISINPKILCSPSRCMQCQATAAPVGQRQWERSLLREPWPSRHAGNNTRQPLLTERGRSQNTCPHTSRAPETTARCRNFAWKLGVLHVAPPETCSGTGISDQAQDQTPRASLQTCKPRRV